jgi:hypothetical protein
MLAHRAPKKQLCISVRTSVPGRFSRVTSHSYFFGLDSGGTNPDTR